jgi:riboflavin kinase/FMN adenylyltransferase
MAIHLSTGNLPTFKNAVITIGTFDGVHKGHQAILNKVVDHARAIGEESVLITFEPHPRKLIFPDQKIEILTPLDEKLKLIARTGIQHIVVAPFTKEFAAMSASEYIAEFLVKYFNPKSIVIGYDHHFGHDRKGNISLLNKVKETYGFDVVEISAQLIDDATVSSTKIRHAVHHGNVQDAAHMLGRNYVLSGTVIKGAQLGRTIGFPTANIKPSDDEQLIPAVGVYAIRVLYNDASYNAMLNIGYRPTVSNEQKLNIEAHLFNFDQDVYEATFDIQFVQRLRDEQKFISLDELKLQLAKDKTAAIAALA